VWPARACSARATPGSPTATASPRRLRDQHPNDATNCGGCGTNCSNVYPNANVSCGSGTCNFVSCLPGHYNLDGNLANGCEYACTFIGATDNPDDSFVDRNCDGIDGDVAQAIFVAVPADGGNDGNAGTMAAPMATINAALTKARVGRQEPDLHLRGHLQRAGHARDRHLALRRLLEGERLGALRVVRHLRARVSARRAPA